MKMKLAAGSIVLNQDSSQPMSGKVVNVEPFIVQWCNGSESTEDPGDVTLTGNCVWECYD